MSWRLPQISSPPATRIRPPITGMGMCSASVPATRTTSARKTPETTPAQRVRAPAEAATPVREREPPDGRAWKRPPPTLATKASTTPSRSSPITSMIRPTRTVRAATFPAPCGSRPASARTLWPVSAMALVSVVVMRTVGAVSEPRIGGTTPAYRPATGLNPAIDAYAMPSGIEKRPVTMPEVTSEEPGRPHCARSDRVRPVLRPVFRPVRPLCSAVASPVVTRPP